MRLKGKTVLVTGAGSVSAGMGIGRAIAIRFAREGAALLLMDRDDQAVSHTVSLLKADGFEAQVSLGDVSAATDVASAVQVARDLFGGLDIVVNNVGLVSPPGLMDETRENFDRVFAVNVTSAFLMAQAAAPLMLARGGGAFVHVSSIAGHRSMSGSPAYAYGASKAALAHFSRILALEFAGQGIRSNVVTPGMIDTPLVRGLKDRFGWSTQELDRFMSSRDLQSPTGKQGSAMDVANAALFLASDEAAFVNGQEIVVDGGQINLAPGGSRS